MKLLISSDILFCFLSFNIALGLRHFTRKASQITNSKLSPSNDINFFQQCNCNAYLNYDNSVNTKFLTSNSFVSQSFQFATTSIINLFAFSLVFFSSTLPVIADSTNRLNSYSLFSAAVVSRQYDYVDPFSIIEPQNLDSDGSLSSSSPYTFGIHDDGSFNLCPTSSSALYSTSNCVSSQDDRPEFFLEPWSYEDRSYTTIKSRLLNMILTIPGATILSSTGDSGSSETLKSAASDSAAKASSAVTDNNNSDRYIHVIFQSGANGNNRNDDNYDECEFYFTPNDSIIQFRSLRHPARSISASGRDGVNMISSSESSISKNPYSYLLPASLTGSSSSNGNSKSSFTPPSFDYSQSNRKRIAMLGRKLRLESIPVLRNRQSLFGLGIVETPFDSFGPPTVIFDKTIQ